jgi:CelD/BcsL family acetyltransferase involved in cellulose biosynthesis
MNVVATVAPRSTTSLHAEWRPLVALGAIAAEWQALAARAVEPNVFYEPAFAVPAASAFGPDVGAGLVWSRTDRLLGLFPARIARRCGVPVLTGWTHPYGPLGTPLVDGREAELVIAAWFDHVVNAAELPGLMMLPLVPEQGPLATALAAVLARRGAQCAVLGRHRRALAAPGDDRAAYIERALGAKKRKELRRQRRRLADVGALAVDGVTHAPVIVEALRDFFDLEARGWKGRAGTAAAQNDGIRRFIERAICDLAGQGKARIDRLCAGARTIAAVVTLRSGERACTWKIAYDEAFARFSPGVQLMSDVTTALLADRSIAEIDSCATAHHPMIDHLWRERLPLCDHLIAVRPGNVAFALACGIEMLGRTAIGTAKVLRDRMRR